MEEIVNQLKKETKEYFDINLNKDINIQTVWDAYKAVLRGSLIKLNVEHKKKKEKKVKELQDLITQKEQELKKKMREKRRRSYWN